MNDTYDATALRAELTTDEGCELKAYLDTATPPRVTIGIGRNLTDRGLSIDEVGVLFSNDIAECEAGLDEALPWWRSLPQGAQRVMLNLRFNLGQDGLLSFHLFLAAMHDGDADRACAELQNSRWWDEVGTRGPRMAQRIQAAFAVA